MEELYPAEAQRRRGGNKPWTLDSRLMTRLSGVSMVQEMLFSASPRLCGRKIEEISRRGAGGLSECEAQTGQRGEEACFTGPGDQVSLAARKRSGLFGP